MIVLILIACVSFTLQTIAMKSVHADGLRQNLFTTGVLALLTGIGFCIACAFGTFQPSTYTLIAGCTFGIVYVATLVCYYFAMQTGPLSYSSFFYSASMLIPALAGVLLWQDSFTWQIATGLFLFLIALFLISTPKVGQGIVLSKKWMIFCFLSWAANGCCSLTVKVHQMTLQGKEGTELLTTGYLVAALTAFAAALLMQKKRHLAADRVLIKSSLLLIVTAAIGNGGGNALVTFLASRVSSAYLYPTVLGGMLVLVTIYSVCILKEKLTPSGSMGLLVGIGAIVVMNL